MLNRVTGASARMIRFGGFVAVGQRSDWLGVQSLSIRLYESSGAHPGWLFPNSSGSDDEASSDKDGQG